MDLSDKDPDYLPQNDRNELSIPQQKDCIGNDCNDSTDSDIPLQRYCKSITEATSLHKKVRHYVIFTYMFVYNMWIYTFHSF